MFGTQELGLFVVTGLVLNATPGVDMAYTVTRPLQHGGRSSHPGEINLRSWSRLPD